jgi:hypothetical protein
MAQGFQVAPHHKHHIAAAPPVAPVRPALGNIFLAPERNTSGPTGAGSEIENNFINECIHENLYEL